MADRRGPFNSVSLLRMESEKLAMMWRIFFGVGHNNYHITIIVFSAKSSILFMAPKLIYTGLIKWN